MKINQIIVETTTSGAVASVAQPLGGVQKRSGNKKAGSMFKGKTTNKPFYEDQVNEEDKIIAPGKGHKVKPGLLNKPEVSMNPTDTVKLDVPLLIRLLEYAREDANSDLDLHDLAEKLVARGTRGKTLSMKDYEYVVDECMTGGGVIAGGGVGEGVVDTIKKGVKNVRRGMQGWGQLNDIPDDDPRLLPGAKDTPRQLVARNKGYDDETVRQLARPVKSSFPFGGDDTTSPHSPRGLQKRVLDREMKKRGLAQEGEKVDRMVKHIAKSERGLGHSKKEAENIAWATANKRGYLDNKNKKK